MKYITKQYSNKDIFESKNNSQFSILNSQLIKFFILFCLMIIYGSLSARESWLPTEENSGKGFPEVNKFLKSLGGTFRLMECSYEDSKLMTLRNMENGILETENHSWEYKILTDKVGKDGLDLLVNIKLNKGKISSAGVAIAFDFNNWNTNYYVMIPAAVYNGNRNRIVDREYAAGLNRNDLYRKDLPLTTTDLPHLLMDIGTPSRIEVNSSNVTTPSICFYNQNLGQAFILLAEQGMKYKGEIIDHVFAIEESEDRKKASLIVSAPGVRERKPEFIGFSSSPDRAIEWNEGNELNLRFRIYSFKAKNISDLLDKFASVRKSITPDNLPRNLIPFSEVFRLMTTNIDKRYYKGDNEFYCPENANWISFGWIGGLMNTFPMLAMGDKEHRDKVASTFDFAINRAQGAAGYYYGALNYDGKVFGREGYDEFPEIVLTRKNADVLFWMMKQIMLLKTQGHQVKESWEKSTLRLADAFVKTWKENKHWGNFVNVNTGEIAVYNTTSGAMAIGGLALAGNYFNKPEYLETANNAADYYYKEHFLRIGTTTGGCADILQNADSETAIAFTTSLMALYEITGEKKRLEQSQQLANLCATWTVSYNYHLPTDTPLGKLDAKLTGAVWASTQNKHGAPGFCTSSGDPLFKIYRATGDTRYADLMYDIAHAHAEGIQPNGQITERLTYCDADSRGSRGDGGKTGWNELNGALMALELPGIYIRKDIDRLYIFDHIKLISIERGSKEIKLKLYNPTPFDALVSICAESAKEAQTPLGYTAFLKWPKIEIKSGSTIEYVIR